MTSVRAHLHAHLRQVDLHGELLARVHVRVVALLEGALQLVQLVGGEGGAVPPVLLLVGRGAGPRRLLVAGRLVVGRRRETVVTVARALACGTTEG